ncbi:MAG: V-type ATP synthase subunit K [Planctomycetes bacterium]|nr:V-type ATP synthase subunit K [Planctomycetota bacterium]
METMKVLGELGGVLALALSALGSLLGTHAAACAALGAWRKCHEENRPMPVLLVVFVGAPLSQTIYGMILMTALLGAAATAPGTLRCALGLCGGLVIGGSAWVQGRVGALAAEVSGATGKGFGNFMMVIGVIETVALFMLVFALRALG